MDGWESIVIGSLLLVFVLLAIIIIYLCLTGCRNGWCENFTYNESSNGYEDDEINEIQESASSPDDKIDDNDGYDEQMTVERESGAGKDSKEDDKHSPAIATDGDQDSCSKRLADQVTGQIDGEKKEGSTDNDGQGKAPEMPDDIGNATSIPAEEDGAPKQANEGDDAGKNAENDNNEHDIENSIRSFDTNSGSDEENIMGDNGFRDPNFGCWLVLIQPRQGNQN